jgi:hypothetical protein
MSMRAASALNFARPVEGSGQSFSTGNPVSQRVQKKKKKTLAFPSKPEYCPTSHGFNISIVSEFPLPSLSEMNKSGLVIFCLWGRIAAL